MKIIYLIRGLPGSGKSTLAKQLNCDIHAENDQYFMRDGIYDYEASKMRHAVRWCHNKVKDAMEQGLSISVANTLTRPRELKPYYIMAAEYGYQVFSIIVENRHGGISVHDVPEEHLTKMKNRFNVQL